MTDTELNERVELTAEGQALVREHLALAAGLARRQFEYCCRMMPLDELRGEARLALVHAACLFDEARDVPFGAYATCVIRTRLDWAVTRWLRGSRLGFLCFTDVALVSTDGDRLAVDMQWRFGRETWQDVAAAELMGLIRQSLQPRSFEVLQLYYLNGYTMEEIGEQLGLSRQRVEAILRTALGRLRKLWGQDERLCA